MTGFSPQVKQLMRDRALMDGMPRRCSVEGCERELRARGYCTTHWARWRKYGTPELPTFSTVCEVEHCDRPVRSKRAGYCEMHYGRLRRGRGLGEPLQVQGQCLADGCERDADHSGMGNRKTTEGYCRLHYLRLRNHGDLYRENRGDNHPLWTGDEATYTAVHQRVKCNRGVPSTHLCVDCGRTARHWSYDRTDPNPRFQEGKGPYSLDINRYVPRCVKCHKNFDMKFVMAERAL